MNQQGWVGGCLLAVLLLPGCADTSKEEPATESGLLLRNVRLIDGTGAPPRPTSILIEGERITALGLELEAPAGVRVLELEGKTVVPGLIDGHVHLDAPMVFQLSPEERRLIIEHTPKAFLYNGVTSVLNLSSYSPDDPDWIWKLRAAQREGRLLAPRIFAMGRSFTPEHGWGSRHGSALASPEEARARARDYIARGTDGFKIVIEDGLGGSGTYREMPSEMLDAIVEEARGAGVPLYVHAINRHEYERALSIRPRAIVHGLEDPLSEEDPLLREMSEAGVFVVPTLSLFEAFFRLKDEPHLFDDPVLAGSVPSFLLERMRRPEFMEVERTRFQEVARIPVYRWVREKFPVFVENTRRMQEAGIPLVAGTDAGGPVGYNFQGYQTVREVQLLAAAGLTPMQALEAATRRAAEMIGVSEELGTVEVGKLADLLVLSADPLEDLANLRRIETVVLGGRILSRQELAYRPAGTGGAR